MLAFAGAICSMLMQNSVIYAFVWTLFFFLMKPRRNFEIAQDVVLGLMAVTLSLPKVYPKEGAVFQGWLVLSLLTVTHTHAHLRLL